MRENFSAFLQRDKMVALGKLAAAAVHEINNPIQGILTFAKLMRNTLDQGQPSDADIASFKTYLDLIVTESARSGEILRNLLSFARRGDLQRGRVDVHKLFDEVALLLGNRLDLQAISWNASLAEDLPVIEGDKDQLKQGLLNILLNAIDAMPDGGAISVSAQPDATHEHVRITIEDSGPGIPPEIRDKIFEPFFTTKSQGKGVGLGLSVVYGIVTQHGGTIELDGGDGQGAQVVLVLPVSGGTLPEQSPQPPTGDGCLVNGGGIG
jgi:signal transduction histidine kinase